MNSDFTQMEDGKYEAQPHEGGPGYYCYYYEYDAKTGEFIKME